MSEEERYLNPETNPFIQADRTIAGEREEPLVIDGRAPMMDFSVTPERVTERLAEAFPGQEEIRIGGRIFVLMAAGNYAEKGSGRRLEDFGLADLLEISESLKIPK